MRAHKHKAAILWRRVDLGVDCRGRTEFPRGLEQEGSCVVAIQRRASLAQGPAKGVQHFTGRRVLVLWVLRPCFGQVPMRVAYPAETLECGF